MQKQLLTLKATMFSLLGGVIVLCFRLIAMVEFTDKAIFIDC